MRRAAEMWRFDAISEVQRGVISQGSRADWWDRMYIPKGKLVGLFFQATGESERQTSSLQDDMRKLEDHDMKF